MDQIQHLAPAVSDIVIDRGLGGPTAQGPADFLGDAELERELLHDSPWAVFRVKFTNGPGQKHKRGVGGQGDPEAPQGRVEGEAG